MPPNPPYGAQLGEVFGTAVGPSISEAAEKIINAKPGGKKKLIIDLVQLKSTEQLGEAAPTAFLEVMKDVPLVLNHGVIFCLLSTAGRSGIKFFCTTDITEMALYIFGFTCSSAAFASSGIACFTKSCNFNYNALSGEVLGEGFFRLGNEAHYAALMRQRKFQEAVRFRSRSSMFTTTTWINSKNGLAFGLPYFCQKIPYRKIYNVSAVILITYSYIKYVLWLYRSGKQKIDQFNKRRSSKQISRSIISSERTFKIIQVRSLVNFSYIF